MIAPIAQWIEQSRPKGEMEVRFLLGAFYLKKSLILDILFVFESEGL